MRSTSLCLFVGLALVGGSLSQPPRRADAAESTPAPAQPTTKIVQTVTAADFPGLSKSSLKPTAAAVHGNRLYLAGESGIACFWRDVQTGKLTFKGEELAPSGGVRGILFARGSMHMVGTDGKGLAWYQPDWRGGKPERKGDVPCPPARQMCTNLSEEDIYVRTCGGQEGKVLWFRTGYYGSKPVATGEVTGKGLKETGRDGGAALQMAPNLRHLYCISIEDHAIACIDRKPNGQIAYQAATELEPLARGASYQCAGLAFSPDGHWLYAHLWNGNPKENCYGLFRRDPFSGKLALEESISGDKDALANVQNWSIVFTPSGVDGYLIDAEGRVEAFKYDPQTGHFGQRTAIQELKGPAAAPVLLDPETQCLYVFADGTLSVYQGERTPRKPIVLKTTPLGDDFFAKRDDTVAAWLGMAGVVVNSRGTVILIDPLITLVDRNGKSVNECNMPQKVPLPIQSDKVPRVDAVCYTHGHADHFQLPTPKVLEARLKPLFFAGGGVERPLKEAGIDEKRVITAQPWQSYRLGNIELIFTPCNHTGGGTGYLMKTPDGTLWHPGDTAFIDDLLKVRDVDVLFFDVPATGSHLGPEGSSRVGESCGAKLMVAQHYGTLETNAEWINRDPLDALPFVRDLKAKYMIPGPGEVIKLPLGK